MPNGLDFMNAKMLEKIAKAVTRLADEQHTRNRLAAIAAERRGLDLPDDLAALAKEGR